MSAEFIKMVSDLQFERFNAHVAEMVMNRTPCGIFFGFVLTPSAAAADIQSLVKTGLNVTCAVVLADVQANALKKFVDVPVITLEDFPHFGEKNFPIKPQEVFFTGSPKNFAFAPYFMRHRIEVLASSNNNYFLFVMKYLPELYAAYEMLGSDESKKVFCATIKGNVTGKLACYRFAPEPQYFLAGFEPTAGDIAIDGGAYNCVTSIDFAKRGAKVYAFEMDAANYKNCAARLEKLENKYDITLENLGLSDKEIVGTYSGGGAGSQKTSDGKFTGKFIDLDTYVARKNLPRVDFIKLDIEGAELDMLQGAAKTITRCKPKMAISAYHKPEDLWTLATYLKTLRPDYEFEFRHHRIGYADYTMSADELAILKYFGLNHFVGAFCEYVLYCR